MLPEGSLPMIIGMIICLAFSAFFSAAETAFTSFNRTKMRIRAEEGSKRAELVLKMNDNYDKLLSTILVGNNIVNITLSSLATIFFIELLKGTTVANYAATISTAVITVVVLIVGEITPKSLAKEHAEGMAVGICRFLNLLITLLTPINFIFMLWKKVVNKVFKPSDENTITEGEVLTLIDEAHEDGSIDEYNKELIENIFEFDDMTAGNIATHRVDLTMLSTEASLEEWESIIYNSRFSRYPIYGESVDDIVGILDARAYFTIEEKTKESIMANAVVPAYLVPETVKADVLFKNMKAKKESLAVVIDEYGGVLGVVTLTDLVECLVGEFNEMDEDENNEEIIIKLEENKWQIGGAAMLTDVEEALGIKLDDEDSETFGGYVLGIYGSVPMDGSTFDLSTDEFDISIETIKDHKIEKAIVSLKSPEENSEAENNEDSESNGAETVGSDIQE